MKKTGYIHLILILLLYPLAGYAQNMNGNIIELSSTPPAGTVKACKTIRLEPGFSFTATSGQSLTLGIDPNICSGYPQDEVSILTSFSSAQNYIVTVTPLDATNNVTVSGDRINLSGDARALTAVQYFDGLGRPVQTVEKGVTPGKADLVTYLEYDNFGRESKAWLPRVKSGNSGAFVSISAFTGLSTSIYQNDTKPFSETVYEPSPLNRIEKQYGPGQDWRTNGDHPAGIGYSANTASGDQRCARYEVTSDGKLKKTGDYSPNQLYVTKTTDEDGNPTYEFKDKLGQVVLVRAIDQTQLQNNRIHDTYYVYDDFGNKRFVLPPSAADALTVDNTPWDLNNQILKDYAYSYKYDARQLCIEKKLPGQDAVYMVYDKAERPVLTQDGEQRAKSSKEWSIVMYDVFGRPVISGIYIPPSYLPESIIRETMFANNILIAQPVTPPATGVYGYTFDFTVPQSQILTVNYYDDDVFFLSTLNSPLSSTLQYENKQGYGQRYVNGSISAKGLLVGTRVKMLDSQTEIVTAMYYDDKGRVVQTKSSNQLSGIDKEFVAYDFTGNPTKRQLNHGIGNVEEQYRYEYDHAGRPLKTWHKIDNQTEIVMSEQAYDELGRAKSKKLHNGVETINYAYNIRSWLKDINSGRFQETLSYQDAPSGATARYNGNISSMTWKVAQETFTRRYKFTYDGLNRLTNSIYSESNTNYNYFGESMTYDKQGNILTLDRYTIPGTLINNLYYTYSGNQVMSIYDGCYTGAALPYGSQAFVKESGFYRPEEYLYNKNGCMTTDYNKGIAKIEYNSLNLPKKMQFKQGHILQYGYDASGTKRIEEEYTAIAGLTVPMEEFTQVSLLNYSRRDYCGNVVYGGNGGGYVSYLYTPEGYARRANIVSGDWIYYYTLKDHLGSVRSEFKGDGTNVGYTHYYPSGIEITDPGNSQSLQSQERFNGKEFQSMFGLNWLDYTARFSDGARIQWPTPDALAEKRPWESPYCVAGNNPVNYIDPDGRDYTVGFNRDDEGNVTEIIIRAKVYITGANASKEKAADLNKQAKSMYKSRTVDGVKVSFDINYEYSENMKADNLDKKKGENLLNFSNETGRSNVTGGRKESRTNKDGITTNIYYVGNTGIIYNNESDYTVMHETGHFVGLADRYDDVEGLNLGPDTSKPHTGFETDLMGHPSGKNLKLSIVHYRNYFSAYRKIPARFNNIMGIFQVGRNHYGALMNPYKKD